jgi:hypothetical protein
VTSTIVPALRAPRQHAPRDTASAPRPVARSLPVPTLTTRRSPTTICGLAVMDFHGRVADRHLLRTLNRAPGAQLTLAVVGDSVLAVENPHGTVRIDADGYLRLPIRLQRRCLPAAGDRVLLAADSPRRQLLLHPPAALDRLLTPDHDGAEQP